MFMTNKRAVRGIFGDRSSLESAMDALKKIGVGKFSVDADTAGRYEVLSVVAPDQKMISRISDVLLRSGGRDVRTSEDENGSDFVSHYREYSLRSGLDPDRLTDI